MLFMCLHVYGSKYSYAENVSGYWLKDFFNLSRNPYDRIVHFAFGFLLYYPLKEVFRKLVEIFLRNFVVFSCCYCTCPYGAYEVIEWLVADIFFTEQGSAYLGIQGDIWDAQKDMALAFVGSVLAGILFYWFQK